MSERRIIVKHAVTILIGQLAVISFGVADTVIAGRYDPEALAILSVSASIYITIYVGLLGILQALLPVFAELNGAQKMMEIGRCFRQGLYIWFGLTVVGALLLTSPSFLLEQTGVPSNLQTDSVNYLFILSIALAPALFFRIFSALCQSLSKPRWVTWIQIFGLVLKIPLSVFLTFGGIGVSAMGLMGCAIATVIVNFLMVFTALWLLKTKDIFKNCAIWAPMEAPDWKEIKHICQLGIPNGLSVTVEVTSFTLMALFISRLGTTAAASHQIASNMAALLYMVPLSFSIAISARISYWKGAAQWVQMKQALLIGFQITMSLAVIMAVVLWIFHEPIAHIYAKENSIALMSTELLVLIGFYHLVDALQTLCFFVLRSFKVTVAPAVVYSSLLWGVGLAGGFQLAYIGIGPIPAMQSPHAFWMMSIFGLLLVCVCLLYLLKISLKQFSADFEITQ